MMSARWIGARGMMLSKRTALGISLGAIVLYWMIQIAMEGSGHPLPDHFSELIFRIVRNKLLVMATIVLLLRLEGEAASRLLLTPHIAGVTRQSSAFLFRTAWENVERVLLHGQPPSNRAY